MCGVCVQARCVTSMYTPRKSRYLYAYVLTKKACACPRDAVSTELVRVYAEEAVRVCGHRGRPYMCSQSVHV